MLDFKGYWNHGLMVAMPNKSGIYVVYAGTQGKTLTSVNLNRIIFIGASNYARADLDKRLRDRNISHAWNAQLQQGEILLFSFAHVELDSLDQVTSAMLFKHKPPANQEIPKIITFPETRIQTTGENYLLESDFTVP